MPQNCVTALDPLKSNRRRRSRARLGVRARLELLEGPVSCIIENLSVGGARLRSDSALKLGQAGILKILGFHDLDAFGEIVWAARRRYGFRFDEPLDENTVILTRRQTPQLLARDRNLGRTIARDWVAGKAS